MLKENQQLRRQFDQAGRKRQRLLGRLLWLRGVPALLGCLLLLQVADLIWQLGPGWRLALLLLFLLACMGFTGYALWLGYIRRANPRRTARHLETQAPELGSSLINFLDLEDTIQDSEKPPLTRRMAEHAQSEHAASANRHVLVRLVRNPKLKPNFQFFAACLLCFTALAFFFAPFFKAHMPRIFDPFGDHPPYSMTSLAFAEPLPGSAPVVFGKTLRLVVDIKGHRPDQVDLIYWPTDRPEERFQTAMLRRGESGFVQQIERFEEATSFIAQTPNGRSQTKQLDVGIYLNPKLEALEIELRPPAYTGLPPTRQKYAYTELRALEGSEIVLTAASNRPLASGLIRMERPLETEAFRTAPMRPLEADSVQGAFVINESTGFSIQVEDTGGLQSEFSPVGSIYTVEDRPPAVSITQPAKDTLLALDASLDVVVEAHDDYGLRELRIHRAINGVFTPPLILPAEALARRMAHTWTLDFSVLGVQSEDTVTVFAETTDNAPEPQVSRSKLLKITAISVEDYNSLLRQEVDMARVAKKYAALKATFEQLLERQAELAEKAKKLSKELAQTTDPEAREALMQELAELQEEQAALNQALEALAEKLESAIRENPLYDVESSFSERMQAAADNVRQAAQDNQSQMDALKERMAEGDLSEAEQAELMEQFQEALQAQREQLAGREEDVEAVNESIQEMAQFHEMLKNFNRFTALANEQRALATKAAAYDQNGRLSREDQIALRDLALDQKRVSDELDLLVEKFRSDAAAGEREFPQAAASSFQFADAIEDSRAQRLSSRATDSMLDGLGQQSADLANATAEAMEALVGQCNGGMGQMSNELDRRLSATNPSGSGAGNTFEQMLENMRMRYGAPGSSGDFGMNGQGQGGSADGYSTPGGNSPSLMGNESLAAEGSTGEQSSPQDGSGGDGSGSGGGSVDSTGEDGSLSEMQTEQREAESVRGESLFIEHGDIVDAYFKKITDE